MDWCGMDAKVIPTSGYLQPINERPAPLSWLCMPEKKQGKRGKRPPSAPARRLRRICRQNISFLISKQYPLKKFTTISEQQQQLARDAGISWSSVQRALDEERGSSADVLADLAAAFEIKVADLVSDQFLTTQDGPLAKDGSPAAGPLRRGSG